MATTRPSAIDDILAEHAGLEQQMSDPALHNDPATARRVGKRFAELAPIMATHTKLQTAREDLAAAYDVLHRPEEAAKYRAEAARLEQK